MCCHSVCTRKAVHCEALLAMEDMEDEGSRESPEDAGTEDTGETDDIQGVGNDGETKTSENENVRVLEDTAEAEEVGDMKYVLKADDVKYLEKDEDDESNNVDIRFKSLFSQAAAQLAKSIKLRKFEEKFSKSLLIRSAAQESMGEISLQCPQIFLFLSSMSIFFIS